MKKRFYFALASLLVLLSFMGCANASGGSTEQAATPSSDVVKYLYSNAGGTPDITSTIDAWSSGTVIDQAYATDTKYKNCIKLTSGTAWSVDAACVAFINMDAGTIASYKNIQFKVKTTDYTTIDVKVPDTENTYNLSTGTTLSDGWVQMTIPVSDFGTFPASATSLGILNNAKGSAGTMLITDVCFSGSSATVSKTGLTTALSAAGILNGATSVGTGNGNVSQSVKDAYTAAIAAAQTVADNSSATQTNVNTALSTLNAATATFKAAIIILGPSAAASSPSSADSAMTVIFSSYGPYTNNIAVSTWDQGWWGTITNSDFLITGTTHTVKQYSGLSGGYSCGIQYAEFDAGTQKNFHADVYALSGTKMSLKVVCTGGGEAVIPVTVTPGSWTTVDVDLSTTALTARNKLIQLGLVGDSTSDAIDVVYLDNIYFHQ